MPLSELIVALKRGKVIKVVGDRNIIIQGVTGSNIRINDTTELEKRLEEFIGTFKQPLYFIVFAKKKHDWDPFGKMKILELIQDCVANINNANIAVLFMDPLQEIDDNTADNLKEIKDRSILLFEAEYDYCTCFQEVFNNHEIGGCIAIPQYTQDVDTTSGHSRLGTLSRIRANIERIHQRKKTYHYALKNIREDIDIMEAINNIIAVYMTGYTYNQGLVIPKNAKEKASSPTDLHLI